MNNIMTEMNELSTTENLCVQNAVHIAESIDDKIKCPDCGESYYMENYKTTTAMYCPPIYKDGVNINPDRNKTATHCTCMNCGKEFSF